MWEGPQRRDGHQSSTEVGALRSLPHSKRQTGAKLGIAIGLFVVALFFVYRGFYGMRIPEEK